MDNLGLSVTIDVEDWYHVPSVCSSPFSVYKNVEDFFENWKGNYDYLSEPTIRVLKLLDEFKIEATFFIVGDVIKRYPGLVELIVERGHEIGCHGLYHACKIHPKTKMPLISAKEFEKRTKQAKEQLEKIYGSRVIGYRAPNALVAGWMLDSLEKLGFQYDSSVSVNSIYNKTDSPLMGVTSAPYHPKRSRLDVGIERDFVEFPWSYYNVGGFGIPTGGGPMLRFLTADLIMRGLNQSLRRGHTVLYFHPIDISRAKFPGIGKGRPLYWLVKGDAVERKIRHILTNLRYVKKVRLGEALGYV